MPLTYSVDLFDEFHRTVELLLKFVPFTMRVKLPLPAETLVGEIDVMEGGTTGVTVGGEEEPPPQFSIVKQIKTMVAVVEQSRNEIEGAGCFSGTPKIAMQ